ncbi:piwi-like protein Siwi isoform X1 [Spodoptera litura]|uniref:Piwi-like protein Siwi isoform X1 n=2 Tax=Spodoptera litura TaxID=69820 RepID=A0A9J7DR43_SPOLT|nr:piwi-like protein Siwi isoform X1 [Spodoptera litura]
MPKPGKKRAQKKAGKGTDNAGPSSPRPEDPISPTSPQSPQSPQSPTSPIACGPRTVQGSKSIPKQSTSRAQPVSSSPQSPISPTSPAPGGSYAAQESKAAAAKHTVEIQRQLQRMDLDKPSSSQSNVSRKPGPSSSGRGRGTRMESEQALALRTRPSTLLSKKGNSGTPVNLLANYFAVETTPHFRMYQYHVDFSPDEDNTFVRKSLVRIHQRVLGWHVFDGSVIYSMTRLHPDPIQFYSDRKSDKQKMVITVKLIGDVAPGDYHYIQIFNLILRKCFSAMRLQLMGRDYFDPTAKIDIPEFRLQIWPGYKTTINQHEDKLLMVAVITHKVLRLDTVLQMLRTYTSTKGAAYKKCFLEDIVGKIVMTTYNRKTYKVDDVSWHATPKSTFNLRNEKISYIDYYKKKYEITIRDVDQPLLISRSKPRDIRAGMPELVYLVPELCRQTGLTDQMRNDFKLMKALDAHTKIGPDVRVNKLLQFNRNLTQNPQVIKELNTSHLTFAKQLMKVKGRQLPTENIIQGNDCRYPAGDTPEGWTREIRSKPLLRISQLSSWVVITPDKVRRETEAFLDMVLKAARDVKFMLSRPEIVTIQYDGAIDYARTLDTVIARRNPTLIFCTLMRKLTDRYEAIKKKCLVDRAIPTQVVTARNMTSNSAMSVAAKVALQMNCKLGGAPWRVEIPLQNILVVGYDVCHDTKSKQKSFGGYIASLDRYMTRYYSAVNSHTSGEELSNHMGFNTATAVKKYRDVNGMLPQRIFIYRDGVGDGQIPYVNTHEVAEIEKALRMLYGSDDYKMSFTIVSKRINTRIFLEQGGKCVNPRPGTVVDDVVTLPERYDFFLISQNVRDGTITPTSYNVIADTTGLHPDRMQWLTYKMTHMYYNCSAQVRVPAVCQYAHKLAFLAANSLHCPPHNSLTDTLYFL